VTILHWHPERRVNIWNLQSTRTSVFGFEAAGGSMHCRWPERCVNRTRPSRCQRRSIDYKMMEGAMNRRRTITKAIPLLLSLGFVLSGCATASDYSAAAYPGAYNGYYNGYEGYPYYPIDSSLGFRIGGFDHFYHGRGFGRGYVGRHFAQHAGRGFARFGGHGFAGNAGHGLAGHGGFGGHRG
jgi:hypothetical protein